MNKEKELQKAIVKSFRDAYPEQRRRLIMINNEIDVYSNAKRAVNSARLSGFVDGASDLLYVGAGRVVWLELKVPGTTHNSIKLQRQIEFQKDKIEIGNEAYFIFSEGDFWRAMNQGEGVTPYQFEEFYEERIRKYKSVKL